MFGRPIMRNQGLATDAMPGLTALSQLVPTADATAGAQTLTAAYIASGWLRRSNGGGAGFVDTFPSADSILATMQNPQIGDQFFFWYQNIVAFLMTYAAGTGLITGTGTLNCAASSTRLYSFTCLANKAAAIKVGNNNNASAVLTGFSAVDLSALCPGMGVTGTNVAALAFIVGISYGDGTNDPVTGGKVTLSANCTGANVLIAFTFFPRFLVDALGTLAA